MTETTDKQPCGKGEGPAYLEYRSHETYALALTAGDAASSSISPYPANLKICTGSCNDAGRNKLEVLGIDPELIADPEFYAERYYNDEDEECGPKGCTDAAAVTSRKQDLVCLARRTIDYPPTKVAFGPGNAPPAGTFEGQPESERHFIATSSDALRIYVYHNVVEQVEAKGQYVGQSHYKRTGKLTREIKYPKRSDGHADMVPITSFDWCTANTAHIATSATNGRCSVWDVPKHSQIATTPILVDMEREVFDVTWQPGCMNTFVAATGNAAIHLLDMRSVGQTTILYKPPSPSTSPASVGHRQSQGGQTSHPMARVAFDPANPHLLACLQLNDNIVSVLDVRRPGFFVAEMMGHGENVNGLAWRGLSSWDEPLAPRGASLATVSDDCTVLLWDPSQIDSQAEPDGNTKGKGRVWRGSPSAVSEVPDPVENVAWGVDNDYLAVTMGSRIRCMRI